ncbi:hypothetical protein NDU88_004784 [Pleurodeles waltl]|uniref:Uncharacterized protein n=1 Tax=Pleurodeles waltl TaxID=8319 RepID=A0AAV7LMR9_PLEWA|nr:hypothetical protein NDU88_004784 [Pleurodeles waltl]
METPRVVQKVVHLDHPVGRRQEVIVGNLPTGEDYGLVSVELGGGSVGSVDAIKNADRVICGLVGKDQGKVSVDASIQVGINSDDVSGKSEVRLPQDKVQQLVSMLEEVVRKPKLELRHAQSLLGHFNFACKVVRVGRAFCRRLGFAMRGAVLLHHHIRLCAGVKDDLRMQIGFLQ